MNISVIIPVYNAEKYIEKAIDSVLQFLEVKEVVIVDDAYPDNTHNICKEYQKKDDRIKIFTHPNHENKGAGASRNLGIQKSTQEYIAFLDADDSYLPNRFKKDKEIFQQNPLAEGAYNCIGAKFHTKKAKKQYFSLFPSEYTTVINGFLPNKLFSILLGYVPNMGYFHLDGLTIKKQVLVDNGIIFNSKLRLHQDTDFIIKLSYFCNLYPSQIVEPVALRGVHEENRITANDKYENKKIENKYKLWSSLYDWSRKENIQTKYQNYIKREKSYYKVLMQKNKNRNTYFKNIFLTNLIKHPNYNFLHKEYLREDKYSHILYKIRNFVTQFL